MCVNRHWSEHDFECFQLRLQPGARQKADEPAVFENASGVTARVDASIKKLFCVQCTEGVKIVARQQQQLFRVTVSQHTQEIMSDRAIFFYEAGKGACASVQTYKGARFTNPVTRSLRSSILRRKNMLLHLNSFLNFSGCLRNLIELLTKGVSEMYRVRFPPQFCCNSPATYRSPQLPMLCLTFR